MEVAREHSKEVDGLQTRIQQYIEVSNEDSEWRVHNWWKEVSTDTRFEEHRYKFIDMMIKSESI